MEEPVEVELVEVVTAPPSRRLTSKRIEEAAVAAKVAAERLGREIDQTDERMVAHLHKVFDHEVGTLRHSQAQVQTDSPLPQTTAAGLAAMVGDPVRLRQAILMNEILQRPEHRWD
ncbi:MAG: hypothetical protein HUU20_23230 [Pirellulales bacterium]|nr:hypothetical protein [Pirellulales bacterium]